jgi:hypothetical protein
MGSMAKHNGQWIPMSRYIMLKAEENNPKKLDIKDVIMEKVEEAEVIVVTEAVSKNPTPPTDTLKELVSTYETLSGKKVSPRFSKDMKWLSESINKYNN